MCRCQGWAPESTVNEIAAIFSLFLKPLFTLLYSIITGKCSKPVAYGGAPWQ